MSKERLIEPVKNNKDKQKTYSNLTGRHTRAMKCGFYFEAMLIDYAMIEDRFSSLLYHLGIRKSRASYKFDNTQLKSLYSSFVQKYLPKESKSLNINSISGKMKLIKSIILWAEDDYPDAVSNEYLSILWSTFQKDTADPQDLLQLINDVRDWCDYRNEIIHASLNKNLDSLSEEIAEKAAEGMEIARRTDDFVKAFKYGNKFRRFLKLGNN